MARDHVLGVLSDDDTHGNRHALGRVGEDVAASFLDGRGLVVLQRNWRCPLGEIDIIATDGDVVIFCEVKTRAGVDYGGPVAAVDLRKQRRLRELARAWLTEHELTGARVRFDVVSVLWPPGKPPTITLVEEAF